LIESSRGIGDVPVKEARLEGWMKSHQVSSRRWIEWQTNVSNQQPAAAPIGASLVETIIWRPSAAQRTTNAWVADDAHQVMKSSHLAGQ
jgi:hypothetical protein